MEATITIVGAGASGILVLQQLVERLSGASGNRPKILLIEESGDFGPGLAYSTPLEAHILNQHAGTMGAILDDPAHFSRWLESSSPGWAGEEFPPRKVYGEYLKDFFARTLEAAASAGIAIECLHDEAVSVRPSAGMSEIKLASGARISSQYTVMALGNFPSPVFHNLWGAKGFLHYPWPVEAIVDHISGRDPICVLGTGLSAIDTLHTLMAAGQQEKVYFVSRNGLLPKVRGAFADYEAKFLRLDEIRARLAADGREHIGLDELVGLFRQEIEAAEGRPVDWGKVAKPEGSTLEILERDLEWAANGVIPYQAALIALEELVGRLWSLLSPDDQCRFDIEYKNLWTVYRFPMPPKNAEKVRNALISGRLEVFSGITGIEHHPARNSFAVELRDPSGICRTLDVPVVINATGQCLDAWAIDSALLRQMLSDGLAVPHQSGGINVDFDTGRLIGDGGRVSDSLFVLGELTRGVHFLTNGVVPCAHRAKDIVDFIAGRL
jgi:uncharacterized NAD(P)/FAD-binding protein YdhS